MNEASFTVDAPDLIDAVRKASSVAPSKGSTFVISAGIRFEVQGGKVLVKATDRETFYRGEIQAVEVKGFPEPFRTPASVVSGWLGRLPTGADSTITMTVKPEQAKVMVTCGKSKGNFSLITDDSFISIDAFDPKNLLEVPDLAAKLRRISWAPGDSGAISGVHVDGNYLIAASNSGCAIIEAKIPVDAPITAPLTSISTALQKHRGPVWMGVDGRKLLLMPADGDQYTANIFAETFPNVWPFVPQDDAIKWVSVSKEVVLAALGRIIALAAEDKEIASVDILIDGDTVFLEATVDEYGRVEEELELVTGLPDGDSFEIRFDPKKLQAAIDNCAFGVAHIGFTENVKPVKVTDKAGYTAVVMPLVPRRKS